MDQIGLYSMKKKINFIFANSNTFILLIYWLMGLNYKQKEIAKELNISYLYLKQILHRHRKEMRNSYNK